MTSTKSVENASVAILSRDIDQFTFPGFKKNARTMMTLGGLTDIGEETIQLNSSQGLLLTTGKVVPQVHQSNTVKLNFSKKSTAPSTNQGKPSWKIDLNDEDDDDILKNKVSKDVMGNQRIVVDVHRLEKPALT